VWALCLGGVASEHERDHEDHSTAC
jgi:hypothetical protein